MTMPAAAPDPRPEPNPLDDFTIRAIDVYTKRRQLEVHARRCLLGAIQDITICLIAAWNRMRDGGTTGERLCADLGAMRFQLDEARERAEILARCRAQGRPHRRIEYSPQLRFRILRHMKQNALTIAETAQRFVVSSQTIRNWIRELHRNPETDRIGRSLLDCVPPLRRYADTARWLIQHLRENGVGGPKKIVANILRLHWKISPRTAGRVLNEPPVDPPPSSDPRSPTRSRLTTVRGDYPNHLVVIDITRIPMLFPFLYMHLVAVLDAFSRLPLGLTVRFFEPSALDVIGLLERVIATHGKPRHLVMDQGTQFTAPTFKSFLDQQHIHYRYGRVGEFHSISLIDRFFRTLKDSLGVPCRRPWQFRGLADFSRRLEIALVHYSYVRPHEALGGLTPIERYYGIRGHLPCAVQPPRGRRGDHTTPCPGELFFLDPENRAFPVVTPRIA
jgi:transposase InsO family protein